ncbi:hypothetical protein SAMN04487926_12761 [Paraburkholderia steynii]|uniref:HTH merR-type domain-containing protein n=1 Tax=Paraburkholderia steynii TaxID=1245441 RepID=A0A7Z7BDR4_9BURK|nr:hypothetical protein SAMN04487926_12761 [Paraburkholderia steynii]
MRELQGMLGVSRSVLSGLVAAGFVSPTRGPRNAWRFTFQDAVLLRTAMQLRAARIPPRKIIAALSRLREALPDELPLTGIRVSAVGNEVAVRTGPSQWDPSRASCCSTSKLPRSRVTSFSSTPRLRGARASDRQRSGTTSRSSLERLTSMERSRLTGKQSSYPRDLTMRGMWILACSYANSKRAARTRSTYSRRR